MSLNSVSFVLFLPLVVCVNREDCMASVRLREAVLESGEYAERDRLNGTIERAYAQTSLLEKVRRKEGN